MCINDFEINVSDMRYRALNYSKQFFAKEKLIDEINI